MVLYKTKCFTKSTPSFPLSPLQFSTTWYLVWIRKNLVLWFGWDSSPRHWMKTLPICTGSQFQPLWTTCHSQLPLWYVSLTLRFPSHNYLRNKKKRGFHFVHFSIRFLPSSACLSLLRFWFILSNFVFLFFSFLFWFRFSPIFVRKYQHFTTLTHIPVNNRLEFFWMIKKRYPCACGLANFVGYEPSDWIVDRWLQWPCDSNPNAHGWPHDDAESRSGHH